MPPKGPKKGKKATGSELPNGIHPNALHRLRWKAKRSRTPKKRGGVHIVATTNPEGKPIRGRPYELAMDTEGNVHMCLDRKGAYNDLRLAFNKKDVHDILHNHPKPPGYEY